MLIGLAILVSLATIPIIAMILRQGTINIEKPEKRTYLFEDDEGKRDNPFKTEETEQSSDQWKYGVE